MRAEQKISRESSGSRTVEEQGEQNNRGVDEQTRRAGDKGGTEHQMRNRIRPVEK